MQAQYIEASAIPTRPAQQHGKRAERQAALQATLQAALNDGTAIAFHLDPADSIHSARVHIRKAAAAANLAVAIQHGTEQRERTTKRGTVVHESNTLYVTVAPGSV